MSNIESAFTAIAIRVRSTDPPTVSASASDSNIAVCAASLTNGIPAAVGLQGFSRTTGEGAQHHLLLS